MNLPVISALIAIGLLLWAGSSWAADLPAPVPVPVPVPASGTNSLEDTNQQLRAYLKLQEQLHITLLAIEQARVQASQEMQTNAITMAARLEFLEKSLDHQRTQQVQAYTQSNRATVILAGAVVVVGLLALVIATFFHSRGVNRLMEIAHGTAQERALLTAGSLGQGQRLLLGGSPSSLNGPHTTLLATIDRLEQRVRELEHGDNTGRPGPKALELNGSHDLGKDVPATAGSRRAEPGPVLLSKAQVLMHLGEHDQALACYEEVLKQSPENAEAHLKKGSALERLNRCEEAIASYDRALHLNASLTQAHLSKAEVFNRLERYNDALRSYEQALAMSAPQG